MAADGENIPQIKLSTTPLSLRNYPNLHYVVFLKNTDRWRRNKTITGSSR